MPHDVQPFVNGLVEKVAIYGMGGEDALWQMVCDVVLSYPTSVTTNSVIVIYGTGNGRFNVREIGMHRAKRPFGYYFTKCGNGNCSRKDCPGHIIGELRDPNTIRIQCKACRWKSKTVKIDQQPFFMAVHKFPSLPGLFSLFLG
jgi:hypothetical protein